MWWLIVSFLCILWNCCNKMKETIGFISPRPEVLDYLQLPAENKEFQIRPYKCYYIAFVMKQKMKKQHLTRMVLKYLYSNPINLATIVSEHTDVIRDMFLSNDNQILFTYTTKGSIGHFDLINEMWGHKFLIFRNNRRFQLSMDNKILLGKKCDDSEVYMCQYPLETTAEWQMVDENLMAATFSYKQQFFLTYYRSNKYVTVWDVASGHRYRDIFIGDVSIFDKLVFVLKHKWVILSDIYMGHVNAIQVWDFHTGKYMKGKFVGFQEEAKLYVTDANDDWMILRFPNKLKIFHLPDMNELNTINRFGLTACAVAQDRKTNKYVIATYGWSIPGYHDFDGSRGPFELWSASLDFADIKKTHTIHQYNFEISSCCFSSDGKILITGGRKKDYRKIAIKFWDTSTGRHT